MNQIPDNPQRVHRRRIQADQHIGDIHVHERRRPVQKSAVHPHSLRRFWRRIPAFLRMVIALLLAVLLFTLTFAVTRDYMARQEERRRLEAEAAERAQHPLRYADHIVYYANLFDLDPALVSAIILSESSFDPQATSRLDARGLMQLMADTAEWIAHKLDEDDTYSFDNLFDPDTNIRYGCWYLGYLSRRFDGDATKIVCAYHAGQGNVDAWLSKPEYSRDGVTLDVIPMENTAAYANRVLKARDVYQKYYFPGPQTSSNPS